MQSAASVPARAKARARGIQRGPRPFLMEYIGPPSHSPPGPRSRKRRARATSAYLVPMPSRAEAQSQKSAPGPPRQTARATPAMLPVPTVPASAAQRACRGVTAPSARLPRDLNRPPRVQRSTSGSRRSWTKPQRRLSMSPTPPKSRAMGRPQSVAMNSRKAGPP